MDIINEKVIHKSLGEGSILKHIKRNNNKDVISVFFPKSNKIVQFFYPDTFNTFLKAISNELKEQLQKDMQKRMEVVEEEQKKADAKANYRMINSSLRVNTEENEYRNFNHVSEFCRYYQSAIAQEINYLRCNKGKRYRIINGILLTQYEQSYVYIFESDLEFHFPGDTEIKIWHGDNFEIAKVIECEGYSIIFEVEHNFGDEPEVLEFSAEPWQLMQSLNDRLDEIPKKDSPIVDELVCNSKKAISTKGNFALGQETAVKMSKTQPVVFIWGPPGTGKTYTLGNIALEHLKMGHRVLMLSYSNISVDGAIEQVYDKEETHSPGRLIRYGYPRSERVLKHKYLTSYQYALSNNNQLCHEIEELSRKKDKTEKKSPQYTRITKELKALRDQLKKKEKEAVSHAKFVATTVSKTAIDSTLYSGKFDVVIFDEASMAFIPQIIFSASLAKKHFICMGDFSQLPPIVQNKNDSVLNHDIFDFCYIKESVRKKWNHSWLCMLDTQRRMHPDIAEFVNDFMYQGFLKSHQKTNERNLITGQAPFSSSAMNIFDLSGMLSFATKTKDNSYVNVLSAFISASIGINAAQYSTVGIITPYNAQARLIRTIIRDIESLHPEIKEITCATVHQFQGSERDVIVFDTVDCYLRTHIGTLLTTTKNDNANRLLNVAITRSRGKFITVSNVDFMFEKNLSEKLLLHKVFNSDIEEEYGVSALMSENIAKNKWVTIGNVNDQIEAFFEDIFKAKKEVLMDIPSPIEKEEIYIKLLTSSILKQQKLGVNFIIRTDDLLDIPKELRAFCSENTFVKNPVTIIDGAIVWYGAPLTHAQFKTRGKTGEILYRPLIRFAGKRTTQSIKAFLEMGKTTGRQSEKAIKHGNDLASYVGRNLTCPECGNPMTLKKGKSFFLGCSAYPSCTHIEKLTTELVDQFLASGDGPYCAKCPTCQKTLEAKKGRYGIFIKCCGIDEHTFNVDKIHVD